MALCLALPPSTVATTVHFKLELTWGKGSPDGFERDMIYINGQHPGPLLDICQNDWVEIEVSNLMPFNSSIHAHGIDQAETPWADGVPGLGQRPIPTGATFTYKWHADTYGSYFYHAHSRGQIDDGAYGPIMIRPTNDTPKPFDKIDGANFDELQAAEQNAQPLLLSDWRHIPSEQTWNDQLQSGVENAICMDSILVNGKGSVECLPRDTIDAYPDPGIEHIMQPHNLKLTNKGCVPPQFFEVSIADSSATNISAIPPDVFDICTPSYGSRAVFVPPSSIQWLAFDIISAAGVATLAFSIDEHPMWVYAVDAHYIEPLKVDALTVANGDRFSVFVQVDKTNGTYGMRVASASATQLLATTAILTYDVDYVPDRLRNNTDIVSSNPYIDVSGHLISPDYVMFDQNNMRSFPPEFPQPAPQPDQTFFLHMGTVGNSFTWALNSTPISHPRIDNMDPPLLYAPPNADRTGGNITIVTKNNTWVDLVMVNHVPGSPPHPIHKHTNKGFILGSGEGEFSWASVAEAAAAVPQNFNLVTPPFRDGFVVPKSGSDPTWLAVRYHVKNPGAWLLHCHIQSHLNGGMAMVILDGVDVWPDVPDEYKN